MSPRRSHEAVRETHDRFEGFALLSREAGLRAAFAPGVGMVGYSLEHRGEELLGLRGGLRAYAERGSSFGIPLLHPWANRLGGDSYVAAGQRVELDSDVPVRRDENGLPIHGLLAASPHWQFIGVTPGNGKVALAGRLDFAAHEELLAGFPYPHELHVHAELSGSALTVVTILLPTGGRAVPVAFGWHPYLRIPGVERREWHVELPVRRRAVLDDRGIPTGDSDPVEVEPGPLGERVFDDLFPELDTPARFVLAGGGRRIEVEFDQAYPVAQVYAPQGSDFICFEPMTAPTNALVSGDGLTVAPSSESYTAAFTIRVSST